MKKLLSALLAIALISLIMPNIALPALALDETNSSPTRLTELNLYDESALSALSAEDGVTFNGDIYSSEEQKWSYDYGTNTLTLSGVFIQSQSGDEAAYGPPSSRRRKDSPGRWHRKHYNCR